MSDNNTPSRGPQVTIEELRQNFLKQGLFDIHRPIVLFNKDKLDQCKHEIPASTLTAVGESKESIQRVIASHDELAIFSVSREQEQQFSQGKPILIHPTFFAQTQKRASGGQRSTQTEEHVKNALATTVYVVVERLRHLLLIQNKITYKNVADERDMVMRFLAECWPEGDVRRIQDIEPRLKHMQTLWEKGRRPEIWKEFFSDDFLKATLNPNSFNRFTKESNDSNRLNQEINFQRSLILALLHCELRAATQRQTLSKVSDKMANGHEENKGDRTLLGGVHPAHHCFPVDVLPAAFAGDLNPSDLFPNLISANEHFEVMNLVGRLHRGLDAEFTFDHMLMISTTLQILERWIEKPWQEDSREDKEKAFWAKAMLSVMSFEGWQRFFSEGYPITKTGQTFTIKMSPTQLT